MWPIQKKISPFPSNTAYRLAFWSLTMTFPLCSASLRLLHTAPWVHYCLWMLPNLKLNWGKSKNFFSIDFVEHLGEIQYCQWPRPISFSIKRSFCPFVRITTRNTTNSLLMLVEICTTLDLTFLKPYQSCLADFSFKMHGDASIWPSRKLAMIEWRIKRPFFASIGIRLNRWYSTAEIVRLIIKVQQMFLWFSVDFLPKKGAKDVKLLNMQSMWLVLTVSQASHTLANAKKNERCVRGPFFKALQKLRHLWTVGKCNKPERAQNQFHGLPDL